MLKVTQLAGFGSAQIVAPTITSASSTSVSGGVQLAFAVTTDEAATITVGGVDAAEVELASNPLSTTRTLRWSSDGTRSYATPQDNDADNIYDITLTPTDGVGNVGTPQNFSITVEYDWVTSFSQAISGNNTGWSGQTLKTVIGAALISNSGTHVRLTLQAADDGITVGAIYIGEQAAAGNTYDMKSSAPTPTQLLVSASGSFSVPANQQVTTDPLVFSIDETKTYIISTEFNGTTSIPAATGVTGAIRANKTAAEAATADVTGYTEVAGQVHMVNKIEVASP